MRKALLYVIALAVDIILGPAEDSGYISRTAPRTPAPLPS